MENLCSNLHNRDTSNQLFRSFPRMTNIPHLYKYSFIVKKCEISFTSLTRYENIYQDQANPINSITYKIPLSRKYL